MRKVHSPKVLSPSKIDSGSLGWCNAPPIGGQGNSLGDSSSKPTLSGTEPGHFLSNKIALVPAGLIKVVRI